MKKVFLALVLVILLSGSALGVSSNDVYVRQDVLNERDRAFMAEIRLGFEQMRREMDKRFSEVDKRFDEMHSEMDRRFGEVDKRFDALDKKIDDVKTELQKEIQDVSSQVVVLSGQTENTKTFVYWGLAFLGLILASAVVVPPLSEFFKGLRKKEPSFTLEDVKHLIRLEFEELSKPV